MKNNKFWNWVRNEDTGETELVFNGAISEDTWFGDEITPAMFRNAVNFYGNLTLMILQHSVNLRCRKHIAPRAVQPYSKVAVYF